MRLWHHHEGAAYIAGGTDILPNIKHRIESPRVLVGLSKALPTGWCIEHGEVVLGAGTRLSELASCSVLPALATAAGLVAGPQLRNMGTLGGNVMLDTRCLFLNQTAHWRQSLGYCLKAEGTWCHVIRGPKTCVATQSSDTVPILMALHARIRVLGPNGERELALAELFRFDGIHNHTIEKGHLITHVIVPLPPSNHRARYDKIRTRGAIDFPQLSVAIAARMTGTGEACVADSLTIVVGAINPLPQAVQGVEAFTGRALDDATVAALGAL
ncbi:MAG TPA: 4-hydroxybenzoyl-CoA reductase subunit beta, partial [Deltaproteobacteria bacterium]|nr:4-hydroxybenzoyl-CoA reductase subunit beta [Deltaproteobacteria bacterium]